MADPPKKTAPAAEGDADEVVKKDGWLRWALGWVAIPGLVIGGLFGSGVHVGANNPDGWYTSAVLWFVGLF